MKKLEQYLDQVCRTIGGPPEMRQHVRQELREHLLDAVAQHKAAGLSEEAALDKALEEFGKPEEMRSDLEAAHGQRITWILDKAMQWKEKTMKAKWLWMTLAHVSMMLVIALEVMWICFANVFLVPKFQKLLADGFIDRSILDLSEPRRMVSFLDGQHDFFGHYTTWLLLLATAAVGLFEWRVKSEHKPWIRLAALGTVAVGLMVLAVLVAASLVIPHMLGVPAMGRMARPFALEQVAIIDKTTNALEQALAKKEWVEADKQADLLSSALNRLQQGPVLLSLTTRDEGPRLGELRGQLKRAQENLFDARQAITAKDSERVHAELTNLRKSIELVREAAKRPAS
jgi:hypothetical protein